MKMYEKALQRVLKSNKSNSAKSFQNQFLGSLVAEWKYESMRGVAKMRQTSVNKWPPSILARYVMAKLGWGGGNYLQLMSWITDPMTSITEDKTTLFALVTSPIFHNLLWLHTSAKTNWASIRINSLRYVLKISKMFHVSFLSRGVITDHTDTSSFETNYSTMYLLWPLT